MSVDEENSQKAEFKYKELPIPEYDPNNQISTESSIGDIDYESRMVAGGMLGSSLTRGLGLDWVYENVPAEVGGMYQGHGFRGGILQFDELITKGFNRERGNLYSTTLTNLGNPDAPAPYTQGGVVIVSHYDQKLSPDEDKDIKDSINFVILGGEYSRCIDALKTKYPGMEFVPWHDAPARMIEESNKISGKNFKPVSIEKPTVKRRDAEPLPVPETRVEDTEIDEDVW